MLCWKSQHGLNFLSGKKQQLPQEEGSGHESTSVRFSRNFQASLRGMQLLTETHLMFPSLISSPSNINSSFHHWVLWMQEMRCLSQVQNVEGLQSPGNIALPFCAPWQLGGCGCGDVDVDGREQPGHCPLLLPGCCRAENAALCYNLTNSVPMNSAKKVWTHKWLQLFWKM